MIVAAINEQGLWDESDGFYYDQVRRLSDDTAYPVRVWSMTGLLPLCAVASAHRERVSVLDEFASQFRRFLELHPEYAAAFRPATGYNGMVSSRWSIPIGCRASCSASPTRASSCRNTGSATVAAYAQPVRALAGRSRDRLGRLRPGESTTSLFGATPTGAADLVPGQLSPDLGDRPVLVRLRRRSSRSTIPRLGPKRTLAWIANDLRTAGVDLPAR